MFFKTKAFFIYLVATVALVEDVAQATTTNFVITQTLQSPNSEGCPTSSCGFGRVAVDNLDSTRMFVSEPDVNDSRGAVYYYTFDTVKFEWNLEQAIVGDGAPGAKLDVYAFSGNYMAAKEEGNPPLLMYQFDTEAGQWMYMQSLHPKYPGDPRQVFAGWAEAVDMYKDYLAVGYKSDYSAGHIFEFFDLVEQEDGNHLWEFSDEDYKDSTKADYIKLGGYDNVMLRTLGKSAGYYVEDEDRWYGAGHSLNPYGPIRQIQGDTLVGTFPSIVYLMQFDINETRLRKWVQQAAIKPPGQADESGWGATAALYGDRAIITHLYQSSGVVYVYDRDNSTKKWSRTARLFSPTRIPNDNCYAAGITEYTILMTCNSGFTYVFADEDLVPTRTDAIEEFVLVNADTNEDVGVIENGDEIPSGNWNIRAVTSEDDSDIESVVFDINARIEYRVENVAPYSLGGDIDGDYNAEAFLKRTGAYTVTATPYAGTGGEGSVGLSLTVDFRVV